MPPALQVGERAVIIDNGGSHIKAGVAAVDETGLKVSKPLIVPNAIARPGKTAGAVPPGLVGPSRRPHGYLIGSETDRMRNFSEMVLRRPVERGFIAFWDLQADIWRATFHELDISGKHEDYVAVVSEPLGAPLRAREAMDEMMFEEFGFKSYVAGPPQRWASGGKTGVVLDCGFSACTAVPVIDGQELASCARRLSLGGKTLTNYLKETVSYRSWNMMDETIIVNAVKERLCIVSLNYKEDLAECKRPNSRLKRQYVLPDYSRELSDPLGHVKAQHSEVDEDEQVLMLNNERICVPETLFFPSDVGLDQSGVADLVLQAIKSAPEQIRPSLSANVLLSGGCCSFPNFEKRLYNEVRPGAATMCEVAINKYENPVSTTLNGAAEMLSKGHPALSKRIVTKAEYEEHGSQIALERFYKPLTES